METWISMLGESICFEFKTFSFEIMICASNWRLFRSKSWSVLRIQDFFVRKHDLCFEFKTFSFETMICASNSRLFRSKLWSVLRIQYFFVRNHELCFEFNTFSVEIMIYASNSTDAIFSKIELPDLSLKKIYITRYALSE